MTEWYYQLMGGVIGPVSWEELEQKAREGELETETLVREGAGGQWIAASHLPGLFELVAAPAAYSRASADVQPEVHADIGAEPATQSPGLPGSPLSLRPCSDCGKMVSKQASTCPNCGRAFHESSYTAPYRREQPVVIFVLISLLALGYLFLSPLVVYRIAVTLAPNVIEAGEAQDVAFTGFGLAVVGFYVFAMLACTFLGGAVGRPRMAYVTGCFLGLFFGPLGVFAAFAIDKRPQCPQCASRLDGMARECPFCHARLIWKVVPTWY